MSAADGRDDLEEYRAWRLLLARYRDTRRAGTSSGRLRRRPAVGSKLAAHASSAAGEGAVLGPRDERRRWSEPSYQAFTAGRRPLSSSKESSQPESLEL